MRPYIVVFTKNTAAILMDHKPGFFRNRRASYLVNPDLSHVEKVPRHFWKMEKNRVVEMTPAEKRERLELIKHDHIDHNAYKHLYPHRAKASVLVLVALAGASEKFKESIPVLVQHRSKIIAVLVLVGLLASYKLLGSVPDMLPKIFRSSK